MICRVLTALAVIALPVLAQAQTVPERVPYSTLEANKKLLLDFFAFRGSLEDRARQFLPDDYVQHNPRFLAMDKVTDERDVRHGWRRSGKRSGRVSSW
jgi:hypothetical protein